MSGLPEREGGLFRMALDVAYRADLITEFRPGCTRTSRKIGEVVIEITCNANTKIEGRWVERFWVQISEEGREVFNAWRSQVFGDENPFAGLANLFVPGTWELLLTELWKAERETEPS